MIKLSKRALRIHCTEGENRDEYFVSKEPICAEWHWEEEFLDEGRSKHVVLDRITDQKTGEIIFDFNNHLTTHDFDKKTGYIDLGNLVKLISENEIGNDHFYRVDESAYVPKDNREASSNSFRKISLRDIEKLK